MPEEPDPGPAAAAEQEDEDFPLSRCWAPAVVCKANKNTFCFTTAKRMRKAKQEKRAARQEKDLLDFAVELDDALALQRRQEQEAENKKIYKRGAAISAKLATVHEAISAACKAAEEAKEEEEKAREEKTKATEEEKARGETIF